MSQKIDYIVGKFDQLENASVFETAFGTGMPEVTRGEFYRHIILAIIVLPIAIQVYKVIYRGYIHPLRSIPGPWISSVTSLWIRWQRWHGRLSFEADKLMAKYGPIVRISPNLVILNDPEAVEKVFIRKDLDTSPTSIRALRVGGHDWTVTYPQHPVARTRRHPVMIATTTKHLKLRHQVFVDYIEAMVRDIAKSDGKKSEDIVHHLRICTLKNSQVIMGGSGVDVESDTFPRVVGEYNFLVVWRLCLPAWLFEWLQYGPFSHPRFRVQSSDKLFDLGLELCQQAAKDEATFDEDPSIYKLFTDPDAKYPTQSWTDREIAAEMAGQVLAATETTSSALAFIYYELAKNQNLQQDLYEEVCAYEGYEELESLKYLDACIKEGLRFRPPVALTGSRLVPEGGLEILGYYLPAGTVVTTQSLSMSRQRPDLFPDFDSYNPRRWLGDDASTAEKRKFLAPFGVGARRCPGGNMATYQMRIILAATFRAFRITLAPETTPEKMSPFEANGFRSCHDRCDLVFTPRAV
ncbi:hypothetical protein HBI45_167770 [Parastagonospora nodorum]|nr:hypothetical protein HBI45_167770 [Parastagonospora nodorum]KAH5996089.1 hypothetical protein HBI84_129370 [Parastagonospora nodorum]